MKSTSNDVTIVKTALQILPCFLGNHNFFSSTIQKPAAIQKTFKEIFDVYMNETNPFLQHK